MRRNEDNLVKRVVTLCQRQGAPLKLFSLNVPMNVTIQEVKTIVILCVLFCLSVCCLSLSLVSTSLQKSTAIFFSSPPSFLMLLFYLFHKLFNNCTHLCLSLAVFFQR